MDRAPGSRLTDASGSNHSVEPTLSVADGILDGGSGGALLDISGADAFLHLPEARPDSTTARGLVSAPAWQKMIKRGMDVTIASMAIVLLLPLMLLTALAIAVTSRGPVLFVQKRVGMNGRIFRMLKFRSMYRDADGRKSEVAALNEANGPVFKIRRDPRVTPVGRLVRKLSIDEVPQLLNVLRGEMTLVGPRPPLPNECARYGQREWARMHVKPGITCTWQIGGRSNLDFDTWVDLDLQYIETWSLWLDLKILLLTIPAVLAGRGAY